MTPLLFFPLLLFFLLPSSSTSAFTHFTPFGISKPKKTDCCRLFMAKPIGIFFGTSTGSTESVAHLIASEFGNDIVPDEPIEIDTLTGNVGTKLGEYDALIVGTPTWNTGADTERSGTGWDEIYYNEMQNLKLDGKKVAVFGLGDSVSYSENYADASGELHDVFQSLGCQMMGYISQDGYEHDTSKAIRGDQFCGLLLDEVNQEDMTEDRIKRWVKQLLEEGILEGGGASSVTTTPSSSAVVVEEPVGVKEPESSVMADDLAGKLAALERENDMLRKTIEEERMSKSALLVGRSDDGGFVPHVNSKTGKTMWVSLDGRTCYYT